MLLIVIFYKIKFNLDLNNTQNMLALIMEKLETFVAKCCKGVYHQYRAKQALS